MLARFFSIHKTRLAAHGTYNTNQPARHFLLLNNAEIEGWTWRFATALPWHKPPCQQVTKLPCQRGHSDQGDILYPFMYIKVVTYFSVRSAVRDDLIDWVFYPQALMGLCTYFCNTQIVLVHVILVPCKKRHIVEWLCRSWSCKVQWMFIGISSLADPNIISGD